MILTGYEPGFCTLIALFALCLSLWPLLGTWTFTLDLPFTVDLSTLKSYLNHTSSLVSAAPFLLWSLSSKTPSPLKPCCISPLQAHPAGPTSTSFYHLDPLSLCHLDPQSHQNAPSTLTLLPLCLLCHLSSHLQLHPSTHVSCGFSWLSEVEHRHWGNKSHDPPQALDQELHSLLCGDQDG